MKVLITICARGGSKGVPGKNIRLLCGKPLIAYTIEQALRVKQDVRVVVSTDSKEIADIAKSHGAEVPFLRPSHLSQDNSAKIPVIRHAWIESETRFQEAYDYVIDLDVTAPLRKIKDIEEALRLTKAHNYLSLFSVTMAHKNPYFNMVELDSSGHVRLCKSMANTLIRRQDAPAVYSLNASIYVYNRKFLSEIEYASPLTDNTGLYIMEDISGVDIDRELDLKFIEFLIQNNLWSFDYE